MKTYNDLDQYNQALDADTLKIIQNANIEIPMARKKQTVVIQNINVQSHELNQSFYERLFTEINRLGGMRPFLNYLYDMALEVYGSPSRASVKLGINIRTLQRYQQQKMITHE